MSALHPRRALLSVSDKSGLLDFARRLTARGVELISTGGTYRALADAGLAAREVAEVTGFPEMMDGRVKTLHPKIHGAILGRRGVDDAVQQAHGIVPIDLVVVNLYPFERTVARADASVAEAIENIDIGGPALLRGAAKNHDAVAVVVDPADYAAIADAIEGAGIDAAWRRRLATRAFALTARYDAAVAAYLSALDVQERRSLFPGVLGLQFDKKQDLRYGENPHQRAAFYTLRTPPAGSVAGATQVQGKELSFNNVADAEAALECVKSFAEPACVIVKHANPCGAAECVEGISTAYERAYRTDPTSAFGGIIAFNRELDAATAQAIAERQFVEVILAPQASAEARRILSAKTNLRLLECGHWTQATPAEWDLRSISGGLLVQERDERRVRPEELQAVSRRRPSAAELRDLLFAWSVAKFVKSNAIVYARERATIGIGAGQMSRVYSARIAGIKAADERIEVAGSVMASDAFFPFRDGIDAAAAAGITAVVQPGGSVRDAEVIAAADEHGMAMVFTGVRHFRH